MKKNLFIALNFPPNVLSGNRDIRVNTTVSSGDNILFLLKKCTIRTRLTTRRLENLILNFRERIGRGYCVRIAMLRYAPARLIVPRQYFEIRFLVFSPVIKTYKNQSKN